MGGHLPAIIQRNMLPVTGTSIALPPTDFTLPPRPECKWRINTQNYDLPPRVKESMCSHNTLDYSILWDNFRFWYTSIYITREHFINNCRYSF